MLAIHCVIFAGGKSSRMGQDKSLLPFGGYPSLAQYQNERLRTLFQQVHISTKTKDKFDFPAEFILDPVGVDFAPTAGFVSAFDKIAEDRIMVLSVDTPFVGSYVFEALLQADHHDLDAVIARSPSGSHPMVGIYHRSLLSEFTRMLREGDHRLGKLLASSRTRYVEFTDDETFANLNHPDEYQQALSRFGAQGK